MTALPRRLLTIAVAIYASLSAAVHAEPHATSDQPPIAGTVSSFELHETPRPVTEETYVDAEGRAHRLSDLRDSVVLVNFWATWCAPCIEEMPSLARLQAALESDRFTVVALNTDRNVAKAQAFLERLDAPSLTFYSDPKRAIARASGVVGMPTTFLIDPDGYEVGRLVGAAEWDAPEAKALIQHYIDRADMSSAAVGSPKVTAKTPKG